MQKLPVLDTVSQAYAFLWRELGTIIRLSWLPLLIVAIVQYFVMLGIVEMIKASTDVESAVQVMQGASAGLAVKQFLSLLVNFLATAIVAVALHCVILFGDRKPGSFAHFAFGKVEFLFLVLPIIFVLAYIAAVAVGALIVYPLLAMGAVGYIATGVLAIALIAGIVFMMIRTCLVFPLAVLRRRMAFAESWELTRGNVWRFLGTWILTILPAALVYWLVETVAGSVAASIMGVDTKITDLMAGGDTRATIDALAAIFSTGLLIQTIALFFFSIAFGALGVAVLSYSYKTLSGHEPNEILTPQADA